MNCPVCEGQLVTPQKTCPQCGSDLSVSQLLADRREKLAIEAEEAIRRDRLDEDALAKLQIVQGLKGSAVPVEALLEHEPTVWQVIFHAAKRHRVALTVLVLAVMNLVWVGLLYRSHQAQPLAGLQLPAIVPPSLDDRSIDGGDALCVAPREASSDYVIVRKGDSLWKITRDLQRSGDFVQELAEANGQSMDMPLYPGQRLKVPPLTSP